MHLAFMMKLKLKLLCIQIVAYLNRPLIFTMDTNEMILHLRHIFESLVNFGVPVMEQLHCQVK